MILKQFYNLLQFELRLLYVRQSKIYYPLIFYLLTILVFPLTSDVSQHNYQLLSPNSLSIGLLFAIILATSQIFDNDNDDGTLEQLRLINVPEYIIILSKIIVHWLIVMLPIVCMLPLFGFLDNVAAVQIIKLTIITVVVSPLISVICVFSSLLTIGIRNGFMLSVIITIPLSISVIILFALLSKGILYNNMINLNLLYVILGMIMLLTPMIIWSMTILLKELSTNKYS